MLDADVGVERSGGVIDTTADEAVGRQRWFSFLRNAINTRCSIYLGTRSIIFQVPGILLTLRVMYTLLLLLSYRIRYK